jgi:uncharacterized membrane protein HdeD (DUF308 family)
MEQNQIPKEKIKSKWSTQKWVSCLAICIVIGGIDTVFLRIFPLFVAMSGIGIITFLGILALTNLLSEDPKISKGEIRKSITISSIFVYFTLISFVSFSDRTLYPELAKTVVSHFTYIIGIIIAFYFGSRAVEVWRLGNKEK